MSSQPESQLPPQGPQMAGKTGIGRRRLLRAGLAVAPVALAVSGRSAMAVPTLAGGCPKGLSPMAWASVSPNGTGCDIKSHTVGQNELGRVPMLWTPNVTGQTFLTPWPSPILPFSTYGMQSSNSWTNIPLNSELWATGTTFDDIFPESLSANKTKSFSRILLDHPGTLDAKICVAYLNALAVTGYALTPQEVIEIENGDLAIVNLDAFLEQTW